MNAAVAPRYAGLLGVRDVFIEVKKVIDEAREANCGINPSP